MSKWFEVVVSLEKVYTVKAESADAAEQKVWNLESDTAFEIQSQELETPEEVELSQLHSSDIVWA